MEWISEGDRLNECCYAVIDVAVSKADGRQLSKLVFLTWAPDSCKIREKMKYASTKQAVGSVLTVRDRLALANPNPNPMPMQCSDHLSPMPPPIAGCLRYPERHRHLGARR